MTWTGPSRSRRALNVDLLISKFLHDLHGKGAQRRDADAIGARSRLDMCADQVERIATCPCRSHDRYAPGTRLCHDDGHRMFNIV